jgi:hypothetical protein
MSLEIINETDQDMSQLQDAIQDFFPYAQKRLKFNKPVSVKLISDKENSSSILGKTAYYDPNKMMIAIYVDNRHPKDMLRSFSHELVHHTQNCRGEFDNLGSHEADYIQKDPHLRKLEGEAYLLGNGYLIRDWETNQIKQENKLMKKNNMETKLLEGVIRLLEEAGISIEEGKLPPQFKAYVKGKKSDSDSEENDDKDGDKKKEKKSSKKDGRPFGDKDGDGKPNVLDKDADDADVQEESLDEMFGSGRSGPTHPATYAAQRAASGKTGPGHEAGARHKRGKDRPDHEATHAARKRGPYRPNEELEEDIDESNCGGKRDDGIEEEKHKKDKKKKCPKCKEMVCEPHCAKRDLDEEITEENVEEVNESFRQKKDNLLFEKLKNRWCK